MADFINAEKGPLTEDGNGFNKMGVFLKANYDWPNGKNGSDDYKFSALPSGDFLGVPGFKYIGEQTDFWSSTEAHSAYSKDWAWPTYVTSSSEDDPFKKGDINKYSGFCVRCIKNIATKNEDLIDILVSYLSNSCIFWHNINNNTLGLLPVL